MLRNFSSVVTRYCVLNARFVFKNGYFHKPDSTRLAYSQGVCSTLSGATTC